MNCTSLTSLTLPASIISLGDDAFRNCSALSELNINSDIVGSSFYRKSFTGAPVSIVNMNENITSIGSYAFKGASISSILIPASVKSIGSSAFYESLTLESVSFAPNSILQIIDGSAFRGCSKLKSFDASNCNNVTSIEYEAFYRCGIEEFKIGTITPPYFDISYRPRVANLYVPKGCVDAYKASDWGSFCTNILELE